MLPAPVPAGVGEVPEILPGHREVGLPRDPELPKIIPLPEVAVVVAGEGTPVHADRPDVAEGPELLEFPGEEIDRLLVIALRLCQHLVVVADLVAEGEDLLDDLRDERVRVPEVVGRGDPEGMLQLGHFQGIFRLVVDVVTENGDSAAGGISEVPMDRHRSVVGTEEGMAEFPVLLHSKVTHYCPPKWLTTELVCTSNSNARNGISSNFWVISLLWAPIITLFFLTDSVRNLPFKIMLSTSVDN